MSLQAIALRLLVTFSVCFDRALDHRPPPPPSPPLPPVVTIENDCIKVWIDTKFGLQAVLDKASGKNHSLHHELIHYDAVINDVSTPASYCL